MLPNSNFGGGILLNDGFLKALGGRVDLVGTQGPGEVGLIFNSVNSPRVQPPSSNLADIQLINDAEVIVRAGGGGDIAIFAQNLDLKDGSQLIAGIAPNEGEVVSQAGGIEITATGVVTLRGVENFFERSAIINALGISEDSAAKGRSGDIFIQANELQLLEGGQIFGSTFEAGNAREIRIGAKTVSINSGLIVEGKFAPSQILNRAESGPSGNAGLIEIKADLLSITEGGRLSTSTLGAGDAGTIRVIAPRGVVSLSGFADAGANSLQSGIFSEVTETATGAGGSITIQAQELRMADGATINTSTVGGGTAGSITVKDAGLVSLEGTASGTVKTSIQADTRSFKPGGTITVETESLRVQNGAQVSAIAFDTGAAGTLDVTASEVITVVGKGSEISFDSRSAREDGGKAGDLVVTSPRLEVLEGGRVSARTAGGGDAGTLTVNASDAIVVDGASSGLFFDSEGSGNAKGIEIRTQNLTVQNQGEITVSGTGSGSPGNLEIEADTIFLNQQGRLRAFTVSGRGGNITPLAVGSLLLMTNGSEISAEALGTGDGGNIDITAPYGFVISRSLEENNDIVASAIEGKGGKASAVAIAVLGFREFVGFRTPLSDFAASSELGIDGEERIEEEARAFEEIPLEFADVSIAQVCRPGSGGSQSEFVITGRGGLPPTPSEVLNLGDPQVGLVTLGSEKFSGEISGQAAGTYVVETSPIAGSEVETQGWVLNEEGHVVLVAYNPQATVQISDHPAIACR